MQTILVDETNLSGFARILPPELMKGEVIVLGAVEDMMILGVIIIQVDDGALNIAYLYVEEDYRHIGVGDMLLEKAIAIRDGAYADYALIAMYPEEIEEGFILDHMFMFKGFDTSVSHKKVYILSRGDLEESPVMKGDAPVESPVALSEITKAEKASLLKSARESEDPMAIDQEDLNSCREDLSFVLMDGDRAKGCLLVAQGDFPGEYILTNLYLEAGGSFGSAGFFKSAIRSLLAQAVDMEKLVFTCPDQEVEMVAESVFGMDAPFQEYAVHEAVL